MMQFHFLWLCLYFLQTLAANQTALSKSGSTKLIKEEMVKGQSAEETSTEDKASKLVKKLASQLEQEITNKAKLVQWSILLGTKDTSGVLKDSAVDIMTKVYPTVKELMEVDNDQLGTSLKLASIFLNPQKLETLFHSMIGSDIPGPRTAKALFQKFLEFAKGLIGEFVKLLINPIPFRG